MLETRQRKMYYRRTAWLNNQNNLEALLVDAHKHLPHTEDRTFDHSEGSIEGLYVEERSGGLFFHVGYFIPKQAASLISLPSKTKTEKATIQHPPATKNYLQGDIFFLVKADHLVLCPNGLREQAAITYIKEVLNKTGKDYLIPEFS